MIQEKSSESCTAKEELSFAVERGETVQLRILLKADNWRLWEDNAYIVWKNHKGTVIANCSGMYVDDKCFGLRKVCRGISTRYQMNLSYHCYMHYYIEIDISNAELSDSRTHYLAIQGGNKVEREKFPPSSSVCRHYCSGN